MKFKMFLAALLAATLLFATLPPASSCADAMPDAFVHIETVVPDALLDIRYFGEHNFLGQKVDGYLAPKCILTRQAAQALAKAQEDLTPLSMSLKI